MWYEHNDPTFVVCPVKGVSRAFEVDSFGVDRFQNAHWNNLIWSSSFWLAFCPNSWERLSSHQMVSLSPLYKTRPSRFHSRDKRKCKSSIWRVQQRSAAPDDWQHLIKLKKHSAWNTTLCGGSPSSSSSFTVFFFFPGSCFWPQHEQIWSPVPAGCGGEHGQANTHWIQPHLPHHHSRGWARRRHQPQTVPQPPKTTQGKTPASHKQVFTLSYFHIPTLFTLSVAYFTH